MTELHADIAPAAPKGMLPRAPLRLSCVVLPKLYVSVFIAFKTCHLAKWGAINFDGDHGAGGEVGADSHDERGVDAGIRDGGRNANHSEFT